MSFPIRKLCESIDASFKKLITDNAINQQPDSRAFGAYVEQVIKDNWVQCTAEWGGSPHPHPGRRTIYDVSFALDRFRFGIDIKSKDLDTTRYSDGGICAVGNLLKYLSDDANVFLMSEFGYEAQNGKIKFHYVRTAPLICLPLETYRIENLGTGQIRLNDSIDQIYDRIEWSRSHARFLDAFTDLCVKHYDKVEQVAAKRRTSIHAFKKSGFTHLSLK